VTELTFGKIARARIRDASSKMTMEVTIKRKVNTINCAWNPGIQIAAAVCTMPVKDSPHTTINNCSVKKSPLPDQSTRENTNGARGRTCVAFVVSRGAGPGCGGMTDGALSMEGFFPIADREKNRTPRLQTCLRFKNAPLVCGFFEASDAMEQKNNLNCPTFVVCVFFF
jgi:hypothetical protein